MPHCAVAVRAPSADAVTAYTHTPRGTPRLPWLSCWHSLPRDPVNSSPPHEELQFGIGARAVSCMRSVAAKWFGPVWRALLFIRIAAAVLQLLGVAVLKMMDGRGRCEDDGCDGS